MKRHTIGIKNDQDPKTSAAVFDDGEIIRPGQGRIQVKGSVFFVLNRMSVPKVEEEHVPKVIEFVRDYVSKLKISSKMKGDVDYENFLANAGNICYLVPSFQWPDAKLKTFLKCYTLFTFFDNYLVSYAYYDTAYST